MSQAYPPAIFLMGPTAAGKTALAFELVERLPCDIISVDSALIYRGMDIGTAKPSPAELQRYPHQLVDIRDPAEVYSVAEFRQDALAAMAEISSRGRIPLLVGGTMMYFNALKKGLAQLPEADPLLRQRLQEEAEREGWQVLHQRLQQVDPQAAEQIPAGNTQRLLRALEVYELSGQPLTQLWQQQEQQPLPYQVCELIWSPAQRSVLHQRIAKRFELMLQQGFIDEVRRLKQRADLHVNLPSVRCVGYRQAWSYLDGEYDEQAFIDKGVAATRQLAKRQLTWLRSFTEANWIDAQQPDAQVKALKLLESIFN
ncbi:tRNA (adenosine(37)-N6)-dimethylallyltransferase MiaA [Balneatrix alpica]|uniref:tRNA dimethylallyltransferase n=1 Tax=Balneatrix alpica TaxID=75684 RepID=A0ABV5ZB74_9GAMM|nr:tRNA (adenosine(37)-N6)-dimethylallyltransferase MiaA [Balneatrix alpica]